MFTNKPCQRLGAPRCNISTLEDPVTNHGFRGSEYRCHYSLKTKPSSQPNIYPGFTYRVMQNKTAFARNAPFLVSETPNASLLRDDREPLNIVWTIHQQVFILHLPTYTSLPVRLPTSPPHPSIHLSICIHNPCAPRSQCPPAQLKSGVGAHDCVDWSRTPLKYAYNHHQPKEASKLNITKRPLKQKNWRGYNWNPSHV